MPNYEIMLILDPKADIKVANDIANDVFGSGVKKSEKMDRTELAYPINNVSTATYMLMEVNTDSQNIAEFTRRINITKEIWRDLVVNTDEEKANKIAKPRPERKPFVKRDFKSRGPRAPRAPRPQSNEAK